jgi:hypothetical protein
MVFSVRAIHPFNSPLAPLSNRIRSFGFWAFTPNPSAQKSKTEKEILKFFKTIPTAVGKKKRNTSANTAYLVTAFYKSLHPYLPPLRYGKHQICRNVR